MSRRHFLQSSGAVAIATALCGGAIAGARPADTRAVGIQLYAMQEQLARDFNGTLTALSQIGYRQVEVVGTLGHDPKEFRAALDAAGLAVPCVHILSQVAQDSLFGMATGRLTPKDAWARANAAMDLAQIDSILAEMFAQQPVWGNEYLVLASLDHHLLQSLDGIDRVVAAFNRAGDLCRQRQLKFAWHPHLAEFGRLQGKRAVDRILDATDPDRVFVELDFFWAVMADVDVPDLLGRHRGRFHLGHVKDVAKGVIVPKGGFPDLHAVAHDAFEDVGYGQLDYRAWIPLARKAGMRHFFVERDYAPDPLADARRSYATLSKML
jgi:sugar phosphate isomerase/epimerase